MFEFSEKRSGRALMREFCSDDDLYGLRDFKSNEIDTFLDVGANVGLVALQARIFYRKAKIYAVEPCSNVFEILKRNMTHFDIDLYQLALGDGGIAYLQGQKSSINQFFWNEKIEDGLETCEALTLEQMFKKFNLPKSSTFVKLDCEGAEKNLLTSDVSILKKCKRISMETHYKSWSSQMIQWALDNFSDTHQVEIKYPNYRSRANFIKITRKN